MKTRILLAGVVAAAALLAFQATSASQAPAAGYTIDAVHSSVLFRIQHFGAGHFYGRFNRMSGNFTVNEGGNGSIAITVDAASVDTNNDGRDKHVKSVDFFNVKQFPTIEFKSDAFKHVEGTRYEAKGALTLHGVTKEITAAIEHTGNGKGRKGESLAGFEATFTVKRSDFGMNFMVGPLGDEVKMIVAVEGVKQ